MIIIPKDIKNKYEKINEMYSPQDAFLFKEILVIEAIKNSKQVSKKNLLVKLKNNCCLIN